jgi:hypothetical protein
VKQIIIDAKKKHCTMHLISSCFKVDILHDKTVNISQGVFINWYFGRKCSLIHREEREIIVRENK